MKKDKKNIFVGMSGGFGPLSQVLPIIESFDKEKFDITCFIASSSATLVKNLKYKFLEAPYVEPPKNLIPKGHKWCNIDHYWGRFGYIDSDYVNAMIPARVEAIRTCSPDFIISQFSPPTEIAARILKVPLISITQSCMHPKGKRVSWWEEATESYPKAAPIVSDLMKRYGLDPIDRMEELNRGDLTIIPSFPEFDPIDDDVIYIGPLLWESSGKQYETIKIKDNSSWKKNRPLIYAYTGNLYDSAGASGIKILKNVIKAFGNSEFDVIVSTGLGQSLKEIREIPGNIKIMDWVPATELIKECDITIHHGGHGSCMLNIINGIPAVIIPTFSEREFNARQVKALGVGNFILPMELTPSGLYDEVLRCLRDERVFNRAKDLAYKIRLRNYGGGIEAKKYILDYVNRRNHSV
ncbi:glycosyltransferase [Pelosinus fermentans]|uniref:Glycosyltransferase, MGT family n=1 Tax=Pelosinus fermentans JBW45 TaxID=1192197 RepID=I9NRR0_9FIRM|nr:nucleotide disphospho-sugar-binding domain-containing protein [Pelosinus fermentans]AJQ26603.1 glycosyltransferase, MGT family [Pelosinus fermentans JBW45]